MAVSINKGLVRAGIFLSVLWIIAVGAFASWEGNSPNNCSFSTPYTTDCRQLFWGWERERVVAKNDTADSNEPSEKRLKKALINTLAAVIEEAAPGEYRLKWRILLQIMFGPLAVMWGLGFGLTWVVQGFRQPK